jgi:GTP cyclohydrolase I
MSALPDLQNQQDTRGIRIHKVGISKYRMPVQVLVKNNQPTQVIGTISAYVSVEEQFKGANMSRFIQTLMECSRGNNISTSFIKHACELLKTKHNALDSYIKVRFPYSTIKNSPASQQQSYSVHDCELEGQIITNTLGQLQTHLFLTVEVQYMSCCPCSKEMSLIDESLWSSSNDRPGYGAHMQRSVARVKVHLTDKDIVWIEDIVDIVNNAASCEIFNLLKRPDEKWVTEKAYSNPKFCEDVVRDIGLGLEKHQNVIDGFVIVTEHEESIHQYNAVSVLRGGTFRIE